MRESKFQAPKSTPKKCLLFQGHLSFWSDKHCRHSHIPPQERSSSLLVQIPRNKTRNFVGTSCQGWPKIVLQATNSENLLVLSRYQPSDFWRFRGPKLFRSPFDRSPKLEVVYQTQPFPRWFQRSLLVRNTSHHCCLRSWTIRTGLSNWTYSPNTWLITMLAD